MPFLLQCAETDGIAENELKNGGVKQSVQRNGFHAMDVANGFATSAQIFTLGTHHQAGGIAKRVCEKVSVIPLKSNVNL